MRIDSARMLGGELVLTASVPDARRFVYGFKPGEYDISPAKKKRSLNANAMLWQMCQQVAAAVGTTKEAVYRRCIREVGIFTELHIAERGVEAFQKAWSLNGLGWFCEVADYGDGDGYKLVFAYHGSSSYNVKQMAALIDNIMQEAQSLGIDTISDRERSLLLDEYAKRA